MEAYLSTTEKLMIIFNLLITEYIITTIGKSCSNSPIIR